MLKNDKDYKSDHSISTDKSKMFELAESVISRSPKMRTSLYNPHSNDQICCIEMINNNKLYIRYEDDWTIKDVINIYL